MTGHIRLIIQIGDRQRISSEAEEGEQLGNGDSYNQRRQALLTS